MIDATDLGINYTSTEIMLRILVGEILNTTGPKTAFFAKFWKKLSRNTIHLNTHISIPVNIRGLVFGRDAAERLSFPTHTSYLPQLLALFQ